ncbi:hypothetical protein SH611_09425 [Geminicoccaceae bacterium 1502E]|nr:hypothetical protein [Geminicoccaceae bacterium 1502E]
MRRLLPVLCALPLLALPAAAQQGPRPLVPPPPATGGQPATDLPSGLAGIRIQPLAEPGAAQAAALEPGDPLGADPWKGVAPQTVAALLETLPAPGPLGHPLARRLLAAPLPEAAASPALLHLRLARLIRLGAADTARRLAGQALQLPPRDARLERLAFEAALAAGDAEAACAAMPDGEAVALACALLGGDSERAGLLLDLAAERGTALPGGLEPLARALLGGEPAAMPAAEAARDPLVLALLARAPVEGDAGGLPPAALAALARNPALAADERLEWALQAATAGALAVDPLLALVAGLEPEGDGPAAGQARALRAVAAAADLPARLEALEAARRLPVEKRRRALWARMLARTAAGLEVDRPLPEAAALMTELLAAGGETGAARRWHALLRAAAPGDPKAQDALARLQPLALLTGLADGPVPQAPFPLLALLDALGEVQPDWLAALAAGRSEPARATGPLAAWLALDAAAEAGQAGPAVAAALFVMDGDTSPGPLAAHRLVRGLRKAGLEAEARRLALEIALGEGLVPAP